MTLNDFPQCRIGDCLLIQGDCRAVVPLLNLPIDAVVTDPPYGLTQNPDGNGGGFMGKKWDARVPGMDFWQPIIDYCLPGSPLLAFGGTRTFHRLVCAIEDSGWEIRDSLRFLYDGDPGFRLFVDSLTPAQLDRLQAAWPGDGELLYTFGSGFPKSTSISKQLDKIAGAEREVIGTRRTNTGIVGNNYGRGSQSGEVAVTAPATAAAKLWQGYGTALKPSYEPICLAMKPLDGTFAQNAQQHGVAGLNVDGCRIAAPEVMAADVSPGAGPRYKGVLNGGKVSEAEPRVTTATPAGRWPANLLLDASDRVRSGFPETGAGQIGGCNDPNGSFGYHGGASGKTIAGICDSGSASRFFYTAKASGSDRGNHTKGALPLFGVDEEEWRNKHPTVKPLSVMLWLVKLVTMPEPKWLLDPFMGSGTTGIACLRLGRRFIGIEQDPENFKMACERLEHELQRPAAGRSVV